MNRPGDLVAREDRKRDARKDDRKCGNDHREISDRFDFLRIGYGIGETDCCQNAALDYETESADAFLDQVRTRKEKAL